MNTSLPLGLDISDLKLRIVQLKKGLNGFNVVSFNEIKVPSGYIVDGLIKETEEVAGLIKKLKNEAKGQKIFQKKVIVGVPEKQSFIKVISPLDLEEETIKKAASKDLPFNWEEVYWDWEELDKTKNGKKIVLIGACKKEIIDSYLKTLTKADLIPEVLETEAQAMTRGLINKNNKNEGPTLIIDVGYARTTLIIHFDQAVQFTTSFESVIEEDKINLHKLEYFIQTIINFYEGHLKNNNLGELKKVLLCGSGSYSMETISLLNQSFPVKVSQGNPWNNLGNKQNKKMQNSLAYTTAIGLALRGALNRDYI